MSRALETAPDTISQRTDHHGVDAGNPDAEIELIVAATAHGAEPAAAPASLSWSNELAALEPSCFLVPHAIAEASADVAAGPAEGGCRRSVRSRSLHRQIGSESRTGECGRCGQQRERKFLHDEVSPIPDSAANIRGTPKH